MIWATDGHDVPHTGAVDWEQYVGDQTFPADLWGVAPLRGLAVKVVDEFLLRHVRADTTWSAGELVDELIAFEILPDETKP